MRCGTSEQWSLKIIRWLMAGIYHRRTPLQGTDRRERFGTVDESGKPGVLAGQRRMLVFDQGSS